MPGNDAWWKRRAGKKNRTSETSLRRNCWGRPADWRLFRRLHLEQLEQRLAPADLNFVWSLGADPSPTDGANLTLKVIQDAGGVELRLVDNETGTFRPIR